MYSICVKKRQGRFFFELEYTLAPPGEKKKVFDRTHVLGLRFRFELSLLFHVCLRVCVCLIPGASVLYYYYYYYLVSSRWNTWLSY